VGKCLAHRLSRRFVDCDQALVNQAGLTVADIVAKFGWDRFRSLEKEILEQICIESHQVVATGGGVVLDEDNVRLMRDNGYVVWLRADEKTLDQRRPLYELAMNTAVDTDRKNIDAICSEIADGIRLKFT